MNLEPKSIIPFISMEGEGLVSKFTVTLNKPLPLEEVIALCGAGKGKRLTNDPIGEVSVLRIPDVIVDGVRYRPVCESTDETPTEKDGLL